MWRNGQAWPLTHHRLAELGRWEQTLSKKGPKQHSLPQFFWHEALQMDAREEALGLGYEVPQRDSFHAGFLVQQEHGDLAKKGCKAGCTAHGVACEVPFYPTIVGSDEVWDGLREPLISVLSYEET